jgi:hypothetical protein
LDSSEEEDGDTRFYWEAYEGIIPPSLLVNYLPMLTLNVQQTRRTLRVFLSHSVTNQPWQTQAATGTPDFETGQGIPSWSLRVDGRILDVRLPDIPRLLEILTSS